MLDFFHSARPVYDYIKKHTSLQNQCYVYRHDLVFVINIILTEIRNIHKMHVNNYFEIR